MTQKKSIPGWDNRQFEIYDDLFTFAEKDQIYDYALNARYSVSRLSSEIPSQSTKPTLKSPISFNDLICIGFFNQEVLDIIGNYRLRDAYINLGTASDTYYYHVDSPFVGDLTLLYYVNTDWQTGWEGETHFSNETGTDIITSTSFIPGRLVVFDSTIPHKSSQPAFGAGAYRYSLVLKLSKPGTLKYSNSLQIKDFFTKQLSYSEKEQKCVKFVEDTFGSVRHSQNTLKDHLINSFKFAKSLSMSDDVCLATLFHSAYSTSQFHNPVKIDRQELVELIGPDAELLVHHFSTAYPRLEFLFNNPNNLDASIHKNLLEIEYCNLIEQYLRTGEDAEIICKIRYFLDQH